MQILKIGKEMKFADLIDLFLVATLMPFQFVFTDTNIEWQQPLTLADYKRYRDVSFVQYSVPEQCEKAIWTFRAYTVKESCKEETIFLFLQSQSLPVINPDNETFPRNFYLDRPDQLQLTLKSNNKSVDLPISGPVSGHWYGVVFIQDEEIGMHPKGLMPTCTYKFTSKFRTMRSSKIESLSLDKTYSVEIDKTVVYRFYLDYTAIQFIMEVDKCALNASVPCSIKVFSGSSVPDSLHTNSSQLCSSFHCTLTFRNPSVAGWQYLLIKNTDITPVSLKLNVTSQECQEEKIETGIGLKQCSLQSTMDRYDSTLDFNVKFVEIKNNSISANIKFNVTNSTVVVVPFQLKPIVDIGGTLAIGVIMNKPASSENDVSENITVVTCLSRNHIPSVLNGTECGENNAVFVSTPSAHGEVYIPYPQPGMWYISMATLCFSNSSGIACQTENTEVRLIAYTSLCVDGYCGGHGACKEYVDSLVVYSTCECSAGWRGYGCTDGSHAKSKSEQLEEVLLLTLSNMFFVPGIIIAIYRGFYIEAFVYTYNFFFSTFYHACDGDIVYKYCIINWGVLSITDFLGSLCSIWVTIIAMAKLKQPFPPLLQIAAPFLLLIAVLKDRTSLVLFLCMFILGLTILCVSWMYRCRRRRRCYPSKRRYVFRLLPGICLAALGILLYAFAETDDNYKYVHSIWHIVMSLSIIFLLPPRKRDRKGCLCCVKKETPIETQDLLYQQRNASSVNEVV